MRLNRRAFAAGVFTTLFGRRLIGGERPTPPHGVSYDDPPVRAVTVWTAPFHCAACDRLRAEWGDEKPGLSFEYKVGPPAWFASVGDQSYPAYEWRATNGQWIYSTGYKSLEKLRATISKNDNAVTVQADPVQHVILDTRMPVRRSVGFAQTPWLEGNRHTSISHLVNQHGIPRESIVGLSQHDLDRVHGWAHGDKR